MLCYRVISLITSFNPWLFWYVLYWVIITFVIWLYRSMSHYIMCDRSTFFFIPWYPLLSYDVLRYPVYILCHLITLALPAHTLDYRTVFFVIVLHPFLSPDFICYLVISISTTWCPLLSHHMLFHLNILLVASWWPLWYPTYLLLHNCSAVFKSYSVLWHLIISSGISLSHVWHGYVFIIAYIICYLAIPFVTALGLLWCHYLPCDYHTFVVLYNSTNHMSPSAMSSFVNTSLYLLLSRQIIVDLIISFAVRLWK